MEEIFKEYEYYLRTRTRLAEKTIEVSLQESMEHKDIKTTLGYVHKSTARLVTQFENSDISDNISLDINLKIC